LLKFSNKVIFIYVFTNSFHVQAIGNAAAILTDPEKRKQYDLRGEEPVHTHHQQQYYARGFESDLTAEELFNMFFGATGQYGHKSFFIFF
jgi:DnaJ-class molecular chaperone